MTEASDVRTLHGSGGLPLACALIDVRAFAKPAGAQHHFSLGREQTAAALRSLADDVEAGAVAIQKAQIIQTAAVNDFTISELRLEYAIRAPKPDAAPRAAPVAA